MNYSYGCMMQFFTQESYNEVLLFSKKIESNEQNLLELRKKSRKIDKKISRLGKARSQLADKVRAPARTTQVLLQMLSLQSPVCVINSPYFYSI